MGALDGHRLYFLHSDRMGFERDFGSLLELYFHQGKLLPAFRIFAIYRQRADERLDWVFKRLDKDFDFKSKDTFAPDRSEAEWPLTPAAADVIWENRLRFELVNEMIALLETRDEVEGEEKDTEEEEKLSDEEILDRLKVDGAMAKLDEAKDKLRKRYERTKRYLEQIDKVEVQEYFLTSLTHMFDPHSTFLSADTLEDFAIAMKNSLVGIGALLADEDGFCTIKKLIPGGPADTSNKFEPEDRIVGVAQGSEERFTDVIGMKLRKIVKLIRGEKGTKVRLLIQPAGSSPSTRRTITLTRDKIKLTEQLAQAEIYQLPVGKRTYTIGVINLPAFYGGKTSTTTNDVRELIEKLMDADAEGLVLDLRHNGGGLLSEAVGLAGLFIPTGPIVQVKGTIGSIKEHADLNDEVAWSGPLIILVSRYSASASEIVTGALKNHHRALVVGDSKTHGKGTVQAIFEMDQSRFGGLLHPNKPTRGAAKITIQKWYLPNGDSTQIRGVPSDIALPSPREFLPIGEGDLPQALVWDSIDPLSSYNEYAFKNDLWLSSNFINDKLISDLRESSVKRQGKLDEFSYQRKSIEWLEKRNDHKDFSLNVEDRIATRREERIFTNELKDQMKLLAEKYEYVAEEVLLDIALEKEAVSRLAHSEDEVEEEEEEDPQLDIHLRESLRIMGDWLFRKSKTSPPLAQHKDKV